MLQFLKNLFKINVQQNKENFISSLTKSSIILISAMDSEGLDPAQTTKEELLAQIERAAKTMSENRSVRPFVYYDNGCQLLPFFATREHAQEFCGNYSKECNRIFPFQLLTVSGNLLQDMLSEEHTLVLNPRTNDEYKFSELDNRLLSEES